jgi:predicted nucleotidyltransferase
MADTYRMPRPEGLEGHDAALGAAIDRLRAFAPVDKVILFGSRARGDHREDSDWDICVLLTDDIPEGVYTPRRMWEQVRDLGLPIQIVAMRTCVFEERHRDINALAHDVARDGITLFETEPGPRP